MTRYLVFRVVDEPPDPEDLLASQWSSRSWRRGADIDPFRPPSTRRKACIQAKSARAGMSFCGRE
jgi:hypothetical protein